MLSQEREKEGKGEPFGMRRIKGSNKSNNNKREMSTDFHIFTLKIYLDAQHAFDLYDQRSYRKCIVPKKERSNNTNNKKV